MGIPRKVAVVLEGVRKYDECLDQPVDVTPPIVRLRRIENSKAGIEVLHLGAYATLPSEVSFEILDRGDCVNNEITFFSALHVPLEFKESYPNGPECGANVSAQVELDKNDLSL